MKLNAVPQFQGAVTERAPQMPEGCNSLSIPDLVDALDWLKRLNVVGAGITECVGTSQQVEVLAPVIAKIGELLQPRAS